MLNEEGDFNDDLNVKSPSLPLRQSSKNKFNVSLNSSRKKTGFGNTTTDFGHNFGAKGNKSILKRKDST
jgi:hypothetical protein